MVVRAEALSSGPRSAMVATAVATAATAKTATDAQTSGASFAEGRSCGNGTVGVGTAAAVRPATVSVTISRFAMSRATDPWSAGRRTAAQNRNGAPVPRSVIIRAAARVSGYQ